MNALRKPTALQLRSMGIYLLQVMLLAVIYHLAVRLGLKTAYVQMNTSPVWPPTGIALAALLIFGYRLWPGISLGVLLGSLLTGADLQLALGMTVGNTLEALAGAYLLRRFVRFHNDLDRIRDVVGLGAVAILSTVISASIGTLTLVLRGFAPMEGIGGVWATWWIGDLMGALVVAPVLLVWASIPPLRLRLWQYAEGAFLLFLLMLITLYVFAGKPPDGILHQALIYMVFPFIIWAALRLGQHGATLATCLVSGIAIMGTVLGLGPFALESKNDSLVLLQTFMAVVSLIGLILAAATIERGDAAASLRQRAEELSTLNDSSRTFLDSFEITSLYHTICRLAVTRLGLDVAWIEAPAAGSSQPYLAAAYGVPPEAIPAHKLAWEGERPPLAAPAGEIKTLPDLPEPPAAPVYQSYASFPLIFSGRPMGMLKMLSRSPHFFSSERQILIQSYSNLAAVAVQNTWLYDEVRQSNRQLHALSQRLMKAQEEERLHLSRELHDESGQLLAALSVQLGLLERGAADPAGLHGRVDELKKTAAAIQENLHRLAVDLRPASLDHVGLVTTLQQYIHEFSRQYNMNVEFEAVGVQDQRLPLDIETALFRTIQESLTNVVLHARASHVDVVLSLVKGCARAIIEDNGVGFSPAASLLDDQIGLFGMQERLQMLGGTFTIESAPGRGTTVTAEVPVHD